MNRSVRQITLFLLSGFIFYLPAASASDKTVVPFEDKLRFYLNQKTQDVIDELIARETQLTQMIENIQTEMLRRGKSRLREDGAALAPLFQPVDSLVSGYDEELLRLVEIYDELQHLLKTAETSGDLDHRLELLDAKSNIFDALEDPDLYKKGIYTSERVGRMVDEYTTEIDSLLNLFDRLERIKVLASAQDNQAALGEISGEQRRLLRVLSQWGSLGPLNDEDLTRYRLEIQRVHGLLREVNELQVEQLGERNEDLEALQNDLLVNLDRMIYDLLARAGYSTSAFPRVTEFVESWKAERLLDIKTRSTHYQIIWRHLLESAQGDEWRRMFSDELDDALINYSNGLFETAEVQLMSLLTNYAGRDIEFAPVCFYIGECRWQRSAHDGARQMYEKIVADSSRTPHLAASLLRLMQIERDFGTFSALENYYEQLASGAVAAPAEILNAAHLLAAQACFDRSRFRKALALLQLIPENSSAFVDARFLLATIHINLDDYTSAIPILQQFAEVNSYPWSDALSTEVRNIARIRLGLIHYQRGNYTDAIRVLGTVSPGFSGRDQALIAMAWSYQQLGQYHAAIDHAQQLLGQFTASDFTYEALVLLAHCRRILDQPEDAVDAFRYVIRARGIQESKRDFDRERSLFLDHVAELNRLESDALEKRQVMLYREIDALRKEMNEYLLRIRERGDSGSQIIEDYYDERIDIIDHLLRLDAVVDWAVDLERPDLAEAAARQRMRLFKVLEIFRGDREVLNSASLFNFPLAAKEATLISQGENWGEITREFSVEKVRIERSLSALRELPQDNVDVELLKLELENLRDRMNRFQSAMVASLPPPPKSDLDQWSELSGFGVTDIIYTQRTSLFNRLDNLANRLQNIENLLNMRRAEVARQLSEYEEAIARLQDQLLSRQIQIEQLEREKYFINEYFDTTEREVESWEDRLLRPTEP